MNLTEEKIVFQKTRDIGEVLTTAFRLIRENIKTLLLGTVYFAVPFFAIGSIFVITAFDTSGLYGSIRIGQGAGSLLIFFFGLILFGLGFVMQITFVNETIKYVVVNPGLPKPKTGDIWKTTKKYFWLNIWHSIVWFILTFIASFVLNMIFLVIFPLIAVGGLTGSSWVFAFVIIITFLLCILSFAYIYSISMPIFFIATYENKSIFKAIERTFSLIHLRKASFWGAIFVNLLALIVCYVLSLSFLIPMGVITGFIAYNSGNPDEFMNIKGIAMIIQIGMAVYYFLNIFFFIIPLTTLAIKYFDWSERTDGKGLIQRIESIGQNRDFDPRTYEESY